MEESDIKEFFNDLQGGFSGTKKWGSIWLSMKRVYAEKQGYKSTKAFRLLRTADRKKQIEESKANPFSLQVRVKSKKKKAGIIIKPENRVQFLEGLDKMLVSSINLLDAKKKQKLNN